MLEHEPKSEIRTVKFGEGLMEPTLSGEKKISLRKYRQEAHQFEEGELFIGRFEEGLEILLSTTARTKVKTFRDLTDNEAREDGFINAKDAFEGMGHYYPDLTLETKLGIIRYEIPKINGIPTVKLATSEE